MDVRIGLPNKRVDKQEMVTNLPSNATAIGLMTMGLEDMKVNELSFDKNSTNSFSGKKDETDAKTTGNTQEEPAKKSEKGGKAGEKIKKMWSKFTDWATVVDDENV